MITIFLTFNSIIRNRKVLFGQDEKRWGHLWGNHNIIFVNSQPNYTDNDKLKSTFGAPLHTF